MSPFSDGHKICDVLGRWKKAQDRDSLSASVSREQVGTLSCSNEEQQPERFVKTEIFSHFQFLKWHNSTALFEDLISLFSLRCVP